MGLTINIYIFILYKPKPLWRIVVGCQALARSQDAQSSRHTEARRRFWFDDTSLIHSTFMSLSLRL